MESSNINSEMVDHWTVKPVEKETAIKWARLNTRTLVWKRFRYWQKRIGLQNGIKTIDAGCGYGKFTMALGLMGADATLLDYNNETVTSAVATHNLLGLKPKGIVADLLHLEKSLFGRFDMACSFGTLEHFKGNDRLDVFKANLDLLRPGGLLFLTVPNRYGIFYRIMFGLRRRLGLVKKGFYENPFSINELADIAKMAGAETLEITAIGTLKEDFRYWVLENVKSLIRKIVGKTSERTEIIENTTLDDLDLNADYPDPRNYLDKRFSQSLLYVGLKK